MNNHYQYHNKYYDPKAYVDPNQNQEMVIPEQYTDAAKHRTTLCRFYTNGYCNIKPCHFAHGEHQLRKFSDPIPLHIIKKYYPNNGYYKISHTKYEEDSTEVDSPKVDDSFQLNYEQEDFKLQDDSASKHHEIVSQLTKTNHKLEAEMIDVRYLLELQKAENHQHKQQILKYKTILNANEQNNSQLNIETAKIHQKEIADLTMKYEQEIKDLKQKYGNLISKKNEEIYALTKRLGKLDHLLRLNLEATNTLDAITKKVEVLDLTTEGQEESDEIDFLNLTPSFLN